MFQGSTSFLVCLPGNLLSIIKSWNILFFILAEVPHTKLAEGTDPHLQTTQQTSDRNSIHFCCSSMPWSQPQGKEQDWAASSHYCQHLELPADEAHFGCAGFTWALHSGSLPAAFSSGGALDCSTEVILDSQLLIFSLKPSIAFCSSSLTLRLFIGVTQMPSWL